LTPGRQTPFALSVPVSWFEATGVGGWEPKWYVLYGGKNQQEYSKMTKGIKIDIAKEINISNMILKKYKYYALESIDFFIGILHNQESG
jgi:hypothetical protein